MAKVPLWARKAKHGVLGVLPGRIGLRNRACLHHLTKRPLKEVFARALSAVGPGDILIDCGANVGTVTRRFAATGATVHAFEPDPWSFAQLQSALAGRPNVVLHNRAVGTEEGTISFYRDAAFMDGPGAASLTSSVFARTNRTQAEIRVAVIDFAGFVRGLPGRVPILKMDVEGAEVGILERLFETGLIDRFDHVFCETHELQFPDLLERTWRLRARATATATTAVHLDWH